MANTELQGVLAGSLFLNSVQHGHDSYRFRSSGKKIGRWGSRQPKGNSLPTPHAKSP